MHSMMTRGLMAIGATALLTAYTPSSHSVSSLNTITASDSGDQAIAQKLLEANRKEIHESRSFINNAKNPDVRVFAQRMDDEHSSLLKKLQPIAKRLGATDTDSMAGMASNDMRDSSRMGTMGDSGKSTMANTMGDSNAARQQTSAVTPGDSSMKNGMGAGAMVDSTRKQVAEADAMGPSDDKAYIDAMVAGHQQLVSDLKQDAGRIRDKDLKKYVAELKMGAEAHLKRAKQLQSQLGSGASQKQ